MPRALELVASGTLLPRLLFRRGQYAEAASAFLKHAVRQVGSAKRGRDNLEERIECFVMAIASAKNVMDPHAAQLGTDFVRMAHDSQQRAQVQLRVADELAALFEAPPSTYGASRLEALAAALGREASELRKELREQHEELCCSLLELEPLFKRAWDAQLWHCALIILEFAKPHREYPQYVSYALAQILSPPREWADVKAEVAALRRAHPHDDALYIFRLDSICATLEATAMREPSMEEGAVVKLLCPSSKLVRPPLPWASLYRNYAGAQSCGPEMKQLWERSEGTLHLLSALRILLREWLRSAQTSAQEMASLVEKQRQLGIVVDLDAHIVRLGGDWSASSLTQPADQLRDDLRKLRADLSALSRL